MSLPYFNMYPTDFEAKTSHLTMEEDGAYNRLLRLCWMFPGCSLPDDDAWIMRRMRVDKDTYERVVRVVLDEFFVRENGRVSNARLTQEFEKSQAAHDKRVSAGSKGGKAKSLKNNDIGSSNAKAMPKQPEPEPEPEPEQNKPLKSPKGEYPEDFEKFWAAFPSRKGNNPKRPAFKKWQGFVKGGVAPELILQGATGYARARQGQDAQYTQQAATWLNQEGWEQYAQPQKPQLVHSRETVVIEVHSEPELFDEAVRWAAKYQSHTVRQGQEHIKIPAHVADNLRDSLKEIA